MASTYSSLLGLELMATGENSGTWGTKTNNNLSPLLETAVCGRSAALFTSDANLTITIDDGVSSVGRYYILNCTSSGSLTATRDLICPLRAGKTYIVKNSTTGSQSIRVIGSSGTGITIPNGFTTAVYTDGTNYLQLIDWLTGVTLVTPALGTPASGVVTNLTGTASININGTVGATTPGTGAFTTLSTSGLLTAAAGVSSTLTTDATSTTTGSIITAGGISCQKSAVVGVQLGVGAAPSSEYVGADPLLQITGGTAQQGALSLASTRADAANAVVGSITIQNSTNTATYKTIAALYGRTQPSGTANRRGGYFSFLLQPDNTAGLTEYMQLTTTGLGIGTTPSTLLHLYSADPELRIQGSASSSVHYSNLTFLNAAGTTLGSIGLSYYGGASEFIYNSATSWAHVWKINSVEIARFSSAGLFGIGMTPVNILDITQTQDGASIIGFKNASTGTSGRTDLRLYNSSNLGILTLFGTGFTSANVLRSGGVLLQGDGSGGVTLNTGAAQPIYFGINSVEVARFSSTGLFGIGMTPVNVLDITQTQDAASNISLRNSSTGTSASSRVYLGNSVSATSGRLITWGSGFTSTGVYRQDGLLLEGVGAGGVTISANAAQPIYFGINNAEVARIDTSGTFFVAKTAQGSAGGVSIYKSTTNNNGRIDLVKSTTGNSDAIANYYSSSYVGGITYSDTTTALVTSSDERIKQNITDVSSQLLVLADIKVREFEFIADPNKRVKGFIAQELYKVAPEAVYVGTETKDGNIDRPWAVNPTALIPILVKAIQELTTRLAALENKT